MSFEDDFIIHDDEPVHLMESNQPRYYWDQEYRRELDNLEAEYRNPSTLPQRGTSDMVSRIE